MTIHATLLLAVQGHEAPVATLTLPVPPVAGKASAAGEITGEQDCVRQVELKSRKEATSVREPEQKVSVEPERKEFMIVPEHWCVAPKLCPISCAARIAL